MDDNDLSVSARIKKFDNKHGNYVVVGSWLLFEDGARREVNYLGALISPPEDNYMCAKLIVRYHEVKLALEVEEFSVHKRNLIWETQNRMNDKGPPPEKERIDFLRKLKIKVVKCQNHLRQAKVNLEHHKPAKLVTREKAAENNQQACNITLSEIQSIEA